jgi:hypothetical protein
VSSESDSFSDFKWATLEEASGSGMWVSEALLDTMNWFASASEAERVELAARALRELYVDGYLFFRQAPDGVELSSPEVDALLSRGAWREGGADSVEYAQTPKGRTWWNALHSEPLG